MFTVCLLPVDTFETWEYYGYLDLKNDFMQFTISNLFQSVKISQANQF